MSKIYKIINYIFMFFMAILLFGGIFINTSEIQRVPAVYLLFGTIITSIVIFSIYYIYQKKISKIKITKKREIKFLVIISIILIFLLVMSAYLLRNDGRNGAYAWDFRIAIGYLNNFVSPEKFNSIDKVEFLDYRTLYFGIDGVVLLLIPIYKIFRLLGLNNILLPGIIVNVTFIYISLLCSYFIVRKLFSKKQAIFFLSISVLFTPIFLYSSIFYSDTLSMPFILAIITIYLYKKDNLSWPYLIIIGILTAIGCYVKMTVLFALIGIIFDMIKKINKETIFNVSKTMVAYIITMLMFKFIFIPILPPSLENNHRLGAHHYMMTGLLEDKKLFTEGDQNISIYGVFNFHDLLYSLFGEKGEEMVNQELNPVYSVLATTNIPKEERNKMNDERTIERLKSKSIIYWTKFFYLKYIETWADGSMYAPLKLSRGGIDENLLSDFVRIDGKYFNYYYYLAHYIHMSLILFIFLGLLFSLKKGSIDELNIIKLSILLLILFLLIWETRSRYILNYSLLLYILIIPGLDSLYKIVTKNNHIKEQR